MSYSAPFPGHEWVNVAHYFATGDLKFDDSFIFKKMPLSKIADAFEMYKTPGLVKGKIQYFYTIDSSLKEELSSMALKVSQKLNIVFASVDIIKTVDNKLLIMEANSGVMMNNYRHLKDDGDKIVRDIYRDAIKLMFKE